MNNPFKSITLQPLGTYSGWTGSPSSGYQTSPNLSSLNLPSFVSTMGTTPEGEGDKHDATNASRSTATQDVGQLNLVKTAYRRPRAPFNWDRLYKVATMAGVAVLGIYVYMSVKDGGVETSFGGKRSAFQWIDIVIGVLLSIYVLRAAINVI